MEQSNISNKLEIYQSLERPSSDGYYGLAHRNDDGSYALSLMVRGVHCAACIQKIERALNADQDVHMARLNFSTGRLNVQWNGSAEAADRLAGIVERLGYDVYPYDAREEESAQKKEERFLLLCLGVAGFAMGNIMLLLGGL